MVSTIRFNQARDWQILADVAAKESLRKVKERVAAANQILNKRESSTIYHKMAPLKRPEADPVAKADDSIPRTPTAKDMARRPVTSPRAKTETPSRSALVLKTPPFTSTLIIM